MRDYFENNCIAKTNALEDMKSYLTEEYENYDFIMSKFSRVYHKHNVRLLDLLSIENKETRTHFYNIYIREIKKYTLCDDEKLNNWARSILVSRCREFLRGNMKRKVKKENVQ